MKTLNNYFNSLITLSPPNSRTGKFMFLLPFVLIISLTLYYIPFVGTLVIWGVFLYFIWVIISGLFGSF